jgi:FeS assembly SUF system protein
MDDFRKFIADKVKSKLRGIFDPEIPINIVDLGLIYDININSEMDCQIVMTLTAPNCPAAEILPAEVYATAGSVEGVQKVNVDISFEPPWTPDRISEEGKFSLGID